MLSCFRNISLRVMCPVERKEGAGFSDLVIVDAPQEAEDPGTVPSLCGCVCFSEEEFHSFHPTLHRLRALGFNWCPHTRQDHRFISDRTILLPILLVPASTSHKSTSSPQNSLSSCSELCAKHVPSMCQACARDWGCKERWRPQGRGHQIVSCLMK